MKKRWIVAGLLGLLAIAFTVALKCVDVNPVGPALTEVGFSTTNSTIHSSIVADSNWLTVSNVTVAAVVAAGLVFAGLGFVQLFRRRSIKKVDWNLVALGITYILMVGIYVFFEKILVLNYRPVTIDGELEASFPSSHTLFAVTIALTVIMVLPKYIKMVPVRILLSAMLIVLAYITMNGRIAGGVHWMSDVIGGVLYGSFLASVYYCLCSLKDTKKIDKERD